MLSRSNSALKELLRILSLGRFTGNGEREKLSTEVGFKYTLVELDRVLEGCPLIIQVFRDVQYQLKVERRIVELERDEMKTIEKETEQRKQKLKKLEVNQERWLHSKDFLNRGEIAEKDMLYLRPITESLAI